MNEDDFKPIVAEVLMAYGFTATPIPKATTLTPDFEVLAGAEKTSLELKLKGDDPEELAEEAEQIARGEIVERSEPFSAWNTIGGVIKKGVKQLHAHDPNREAFHVIWMHSWGRDQELLKELVVSTIFGAQSLISMNRSGVIHCYYYGESSFFTHKDALDGVINSIATGPHDLELSLCVNTLSPRIEQFRGSKIYQAFHAGLTDPDVLEAKGEAWIADCQIDRGRKHEPLVLEYLRKKYTVDHLQPFTMQQHSAIGAAEAWLRRGGVGAVDN